MRTDVIVIGGGIAGIAAAVRLAREGVRVELLETRKKLGGRATSHRDPKSGELIDNCQHVTLGCCVNYLKLLDDIGAADKLTWTDRQWWVEPGGRTSVLEPWLLPAPFHATLSFLCVKFLSPGEKAAVARAIAAAMRTDRSTWVGRTFREFLDQTNQPPHAVARFWTPIVVSACNLSVDRVSAEAALQVIQQAFLASAEAGRIGLANVPLVELYENVPALIESGGGRVQTGASVRSFDERSVKLASGEAIEADRVICALPFERAISAADDALRARDSRFGQMASLGHSPIIGVHLAFDRPVIETPHAVLLDRMTDWLFRKDNAGTTVHAVISAADEFVGLAEAELIERVVGDLRACLPGAAGPQLVSGRAIKEKRATFAATADSDRYRPTAVSEETSLVLAGDWVRTGWPATMEGATRAGLIAADAVLEGASTSGHHVDSSLESELRGRGLSSVLLSRAAFATVR
ncbi:MAG: hydroxysqualene dehydroxylase HpnE [Planctomycetota bacterium]